MNCVIIEDEDSAIEQLESYLAQTGHPVHIQARIDSIEEAVPWLRQNQTDLIFLDVQLADGISFEIFDHVQVRTPVIFITSYDQYMTRAFDLNSIAYLLKPLKPDALKAAIGKYAYLNSGLTAGQAVQPLHREHQRRFLVSTGSTLITVPADEVAFFYVQNRTFLFLVTRSKQQYLYDSTLEILEQRIDPAQFFRINRQCIIHAGIIRQVHRHDARGRLRIETDPVAKEEMIVSISRASAFKSWLDR